MHHKKELFIIYVYGQDILMNKSTISIILLAKTYTHYWEADINSAKLQNIFLIFKFGGIRIWSLWLKCRTDASTCLELHCLVISESMQDA